MSSCILGEKLSIIRRKQSSACFNGQDFDVIRMMKPCDCIEEDFGCDLCYERQDPDDSTSKCVRSRTCDIDVDKEPDVCNGFWNKTQGYQKVPGTRCTGGLESSRIPLRVSCGHHMGIFGILSLVTFGLLSVLGGIALFLYFHRNNPILQSVVIPPYLSSFWKRDSSNPVYQPLATDLLGDDAHLLDDEEISNFTSGEDDGHQESTPSSSSLP